MAATKLAGIIGAVCVGAGLYTLGVWPMLQKGLQIKDDPELRCILLVFSGLGFLFIVFAISAWSFIYRQASEWQWLGLGRRFWLWMIAICYVAGIILYLLLQTPLLSPRPTTGALASKRTAVIGSSLLLPLE